MECFESVTENENQGNCSISSARLTNISAAARNSNQRTNGRESVKCDLRHFARFAPTAQSLRRRMDPDQATVPVVDADEAGASVPAPLEAEDVQHAVAQSGPIPAETAGESSPLSAE